MSTVENIVRSGARSLELSDPLTVGLARQWNDLAHYLRSEVWVARTAVCCSFAGAVLVQAGLFSLVAQLIFDLDTTLLPSLAASVGGLALGSLMVLGNRALTAQPSRPALS